jgi:molybdopterin-guanine dinucleotide biosynthesis protein A
VPIRHGRADEGLSRRRFDSLVGLDMSTESDLAAAILAGGRARRFDGVNKGTLVIGRTAIIDRQLETLRQVAREIFVVGREDPEWTTRGLPVVPDEIPGAGPLGGIYTAIVRSPRDRTLVVACDMPFLSGALLHRLAAVQDADVVIPRHAKGYEPLCAIYSRACAEDIRDRLARGINEASRLPAGVRVTEFDIDEGTFFVNVNTPHDYERAKGLIE